MKKVITLAFMAAAFMVAAPANAQVKFGIKGGLNLTNLTFSESAIKKDNQAGFFIGPTVKLTLPVTGLSFDAAALFDQRSAKVGVTDEAKKTMKQQSIQIPINVRYGVGLSSVANVFVFAGPQFGFNVGDKKIEDIDWEWKSSNFSVNVGLGATVLSHLQVTANYNIACGKTGSTVREMYKEIRGHNNAWQLGVAYFF